MSRQLASSGSAWEQKIGYSRAVKVGNLISVSGTTATDDNGETAHKDDLYGQTKFILAKVEKVLEGLGASFSDVIRTRMFITDISRWEEAGRAHGEFFSEIRPATTMVEISGLISPDHLIEIEVDAVIS